MSQKTWLTPILVWISPLSKSLIAEDGFDPSTSGLWAKHASAAPLCYLAFELGIKPTIIDRGGHLLKLSFPTGKTKVVVTLHGSGPDIIHKGLKVS